MSDLSFREAAEYLGVSTATIQNWTRQGVFSDVKSHGISLSALIRFQRQLKRGETGRLKARANKSSASRTFLPGEYLETPLSGKNIASLASQLQTLNSSTELILYSYFLNKIQDRACSPYVTGEMNKWYEELNRPDCKKLVNQLKEIPIPEQRDSAGLIYQLLQKEGRKSRRGSYYTPPEMSEKILSCYRGLWRNFLDPCCGSGIFLLHAAQSCGSPLSVEGWDSDPTAVHIARLNLMLSFPDFSFEPRIYLRDSLKYPFDEKYDFIATNPPWGHHFHNSDMKELRGRYPQIKTGESFSLFLASSLERLSPKGVLSFLLPEALLKVKTHRDIREFLLDNCHMSRMFYLGKPFQNVQTEVIRLDLQKKKECNFPTTVLRNNNIFSVDAGLFRKNPHCFFNFNCSSRDRAILERVYSSKHCTLKNNTDWILGVVSGNNDKFISSEQQEGYVPIVSGKDITAFRIEEPKKFLLFNRKVLQQCATKSSYSTAPKIIYRFITGRPVFAIDRKGLVTLNSANSFRPESKRSPEVITAFFNSSLYRFILGKRFNSIKVLRNHLEELPVPDLTKTEISEIEAQVRQIETGSEEKCRTLIETLDQRVFNFYEIPHSDRKYILENI